MNQAAKEPSQDSPPPPSAALRFVREAKQEEASEDKIVAIPSDSPSLPREERDRPRSQKKKKQPEPAAELKQLYEPFTIRLRTDLKRRLKRLRNRREDEGHAVQTLQEFVEQAFEEWLERNDESA